ncbi:uncharacterized protein A4U43_C01F16150 [Asparagus officinalis]|uniref:Uncharacterized protein n=1 Tax=Asparagus officinalis TaxID=4686 RepID=A0A5P1FPR7_ASPOF|nr:uncharacterized protein A4U43_C01F16150 [Asparagus officinalis]
MGELRIRGGPPARSFSSHCQHWHHRGERRGEEDEERRSLEERRDGKERSYPTSETRRLASGESSMVAKLEQSASRQDIGRRKETEREEDKRRREEDERREGGVIPYQGYVDEKSNAADKGTDFHIGHGSVSVNSGKGPMVSVDHGNAGVHNSNGTNVNVGHAWWRPNKRRPLTLSRRRT